MYIYLSMLGEEDEKDLFIHIYENYRYFMWYIANEVLQDKFLAEDAVQDSFMTLTRHIKKVQGMNEASLKKFLSSIVRSRSIDIVRKNSYKKEFSYENIAEITAVSQEDVLEDLISEANYQELLNCIKKLDDKYRLIFEYKYLHYLSDKQIGEIMDISAKTVNVRFYRARIKLQNMLEKGVV